MSSEKLNSAIAAIKAGDKATGSRSLAEILKEEPSNEAAWLWLATCMDDVGKKIYCLKKALSINPNNQAVIKALSKLEIPPQPNLEDTQPTYLAIKIPSMDVPNPIEEKPAHVPEKYTSLEKDSFDGTNIEEPKALPLKKCPYCAEQIQKDAIVCRYCGRDLSSGRKNVNENGIMTVVSVQPAQIKKGKQNAFTGRFLGPTILGLSSALIMGMGCFLPFIRLPIVGSMTYFDNGQGDGIIVVLVSIVAIITLLFRGYFISGVGSVISGVVVLNTISKMSSAIKVLKEDMSKELADNPFAGLAESLLQTVQIDVGAYVIIIGAILLMAASIWGVIALRQKD